MTKIEQLVFEKFGQASLEIYKDLYKNKCDSFMQYQLADERLIGFMLALESSERNA